MYRLYKDGTAENVNMPRVANVCKNGCTKCAREQKLLINQAKKVKYKMHFYLKLKKMHKRRKQRELVN